MYLWWMRQMAGVVVVACLSFSAAAQADTAIIGTVSNAETKEPVPDVVVSATSPSLQGERVVVADAQGQFRIPDVPPSVYTLRFDKESFKPFSRTDIPVRPDRTVRVTVALEPMPMEDEYPGCGSPVVDVGSTTTGMNIYQDFTQHFALNRPMDKRGAARSFESLAELAPGARSDAYGASIHGASPFENAYWVDGLSTNEPVLGVNALPLSTEFLQDLSIVTGGYMPEHGRATGGVFRAVTRTGSNEFHGSVFGNWVPGFLGGTPEPASGPTWTITGQNRLSLQGDVGATLGGPILKDRLWFFAGVAPAFTRVEHTRTLTARRLGPDGANVSTPIPGTSHSFHAEERSLQAMGKLTWFLTDHRQNLSLSVITTPARSGGDGMLTVDPLTGGVREFINGSPTAVPYRELDGNFTTAALTYSGTFLDHRLYVDTNLAWSRQTASSTPYVTGLSPARFTARRPVTYYERSVPDMALYCGADEAEQLSRCPVLYYDVGGEDVLSLDSVDRYQANARATGLLDFLGNHVVKAGVDAERLSYEHGQVLNTNRYDSTTLGGFAQDSWNPIRWLIINAGVRYDAQWLHTSTDPRTFTVGQQLSPRVGLVVDPMANGRMKLFAHYAKYRGQMPLGLLDGVSPSFSGQEPVDPDLVPPSSSELVAGAEWEVLVNIRLLATYTHRGLDSVIENLNRGDGVSPTFLGNPGMGLARDFPKAERTYDAVTVAVDRVITWDWLLQASYTWSRLHGNYAGPFRPGLDWGEPVLRSDFTFPSQLANRSGPLPNDRTHTVRVFGAKEFDLTRALTASLGLSYRGQSGTPINYLGGHPEAGMGETFVLPRGSAGERTPWIHTIDARLGVNYQLARGKVVSISLEAFNLFNFQEVTRVNEIYTYEPVLPVETGVDAGELTPNMVRTVNGQPLTAANPEFLKPTQYQVPRQVRIGLRYTF
ncbi:TonB-dependent receptor [Archangium lansingense]|uniref:TonB-dependent receptor n=1 Tax=Archangium lansingense TaxID=2995310 RepID=A0ABT4A5F9_9BACT|nr:TonB-dependent receptor [Archangium lansinium]MCY1076519.1 TonB-dependent receptor [Archangium lansinium]